MMLAWALLGMPLASVLGLGAALGTIIVGLYFLGVRRRRIQVPFIELWSELLATQKKAALRSQLTRLFSLLLQLLLLFLLLLALADPRPTARDGAGRSLVLLMDVSASMSSERNGETRLERAQARAKQLVEGLGAKDQILLVEMGARPRPLLGWTNERGALTSQLETLVPLDASADFSSALRLAADALGSREGSEIVVLSDGALEIPPQSSLPELRAKLSFEPTVPAEQVIGSGLENVAITTFAARRYPRSLGGFEVLYAVLNAGSNDAEVEVVIRAAGEPGRPGPVLELQRLRIAAGGTERRTSADLSGADGRLIAEVHRVDGITDGFHRDDVAYTLLPPERTVRVLVVGGPNTFLDAALLVDASVEIERCAVAAYPPAASFDVTIFDEAAPPRVARTGAALYLGLPPGTDSTSSLPAGSPIDGSFPVRADKPLTSFGFDHWQKTHPVFEFFDPYDIQVLKGRALIPAPGDEVLGRSDEGAIFVSGRRQEGPFLALGFAPRDSDFVLRVAFPIFLRNAINALLPEKVETRLASSATGQLWRFSVPGLTRGHALVKGPTSRPAADLKRTQSLTHARPLATNVNADVVVPVEAEQAVLFTQQAGFYEVIGGSRPVALAASLLDSSESRLAPRAELQIGERKAKRVEGLTPREKREPWIWVVLCVLGISLVEWFTYHRRWTV